ncbi:hypothetical protein ACIP5Y_21515 [Nocardia sp. NPDC088792]|uniref:hypothetical protein n=1 Tax=Nocardia sp. NPDC088792 TaxID=3364332 RepID=UPI00380D7877
MTDDSGREYEVHSAAEYISARWRRGHQEKPAQPAPKPVPTTPAAPAVSSAPALIQKSKEI